MWTGLGSNRSTRSFIRVRNPHGLPDPLMRCVNVPARVKPLLQQIGRIAGRCGAPSYAVGGCVRDWLLGIERAADLDVTVEGNGIDLARAVARELKGTVIAHQSFGTATVTLADEVPSRVDFASCRREAYVKPAAYPRVSPGTLEDDLFRRDYTMNAMAVAIAPGRFGRLVDPFEGAQDLQRKALRVLHDRSFLDDPSRILRGVRFLQRFGLQWEPGTERAVREAVAAGALGWLNPGRLGKELNLMCREPDPIACFRSLAELLDGGSRRA